MDIVGIFKDSIGVAKKNPVILAPAVAVSIITALLAMGLAGVGMMTAGMMGGMGSPGGAMGAVGAMMGLAFIMTLVSMVLGLAAHGMAVGMAREAAQSGATSLSTGISTAAGRLVQLVAGAVLVSLAVWIGMMLLVIPGIIAAFFLMFTFVVIVVDNSTAVEAMKRSIDLVKANLSDMIVCFLIAVAAAIAVSLVSMVFRFIPVIGQLAGSLLMGLLSGYLTIVIVKVYMVLTSKTTSELV